MPHNTRLESYVSKHKQLEHHNTSAGMVNDMFMLHAQLESERAALTHSSARSATGGARRPAARAEAAKGHGLTDAHASKGQRQAMAMLALVEAQRYSAAALFKRGEGSVARALKRKRAEEADLAAAVPRAKVEALKQTHAAGPSGQARRPVQPAAALQHLAPVRLEAGQKATKAHGTGRSAADLAVRKRQKAAEKRNASAQPKQKKRTGGGRLTEKQHRAAAARAEVPPSVRPPKRPRAAAEAAASRVQRLNDEEEQQEREEETQAAKVVRIRAEDAVCEAARAERQAAAEAQRYADAATAEARRRAEWEAAQQQQKEAKQREYTELRRALKALRAQCSGGQLTPKQVNRLGVGEKVARYEELKSELGL
jgi:hypothetical protein